MRSEAETRKELIDKKHDKAGWDVENRSQVIQEFDISVPLPEEVSEAHTEWEGHRFSDYVLLGRDGNPLAVVEARSEERRVGKECRSRWSPYH